MKHYQNKETLYNKSQNSHTSQAKKENVNNENNNYISNK